jgi:hypothetical protein
MTNADRHMKTSSPFAPFLEPRNLRRMAGGVSFERGEGAAVGRLKRFKRKLSAKN